MNKHEFLAALRRKLKKLPYAEVENAINYYEEYFNEAGKENEQQVLMQLGSPDLIASKIMGEYVINETKTTSGSGGKSPWLIILAIIASPIALSVAVTAAALVFAAFVTYFAFGVSGVALIAGGVFSVMLSVRMIFTEFPTALFFFGFGLFSFSAGVAILLGSVKLSKVSGIGLQKMLGKLLIRRSAE